jgi:hypothetical protein
MKNKLGYLGLCCALILGSSVCIHLPDTFTPTILVQDVVADFPALGCEHMKQVVSKPLTYLGKGSQAIVFASADGQYVLKFFLTQRFHTKLRIRMPFKQTPPSRIRWDVLERYAVAFEKVQEETGLVALHLSANTYDLPQAVLQDPQGNLHTIDLNHFSFLLQKRCTCLADSFHNMSSPQQEEVAQALEKLMTSLACKGFYNLRGSFKDKNFAMLNQKAFIIDVGNFVFREELLHNPETEITRGHVVLSTWLSKNRKNIPSCKNRSVYAQNE